jgi:hypothetical protein
MQKKVAVAIPIYKQNLTENDKRSLTQCQKILGEFPIYFIQPEELNNASYKSIIPNSNQISFSPNYFKSIQGYSQLMLSPQFYAKFKDYEYVLIYQTDAYVFSNQLKFWCDKNYDYIGAPWLSKPPLVKGKPIVDMTPWFINKVGNGGFSLRKVRTHYLNTLIFRPFLKYFIKNEDMFWGLFIEWLNPFFKKPNYQEASNFAIEMDKDIAFKFTNGQLPFGVHAWEKYEFEFWKNWVR